MSAMMVNSSNPRHAGVSIISEDEVATAVDGKPIFAFGFLIVLNQMHYFNVLENRNAKCDTEIKNVNYIL
jgi:hypothetical protein